MMAGVFPCSAVPSHGPWHRRLTAAVAGLVLAPGLSWAAPAGEAPTLSPDPLSGMVLRTSLGLVAVLVLIFALAWIARRWGGALRTPSALPLRVVSQVSLGARERIVVVEADDIWLVIGITPGGMRTLHTLPARPEADAAPAAATGFVARLQQARQRREP